MKCYRAPSGDASWARKGRQIKIGENTTYGMQHMSTVKQEQPAKPLKV